jgi:hypothetical protein
MERLLHYNCGTPLYGPGQRSRPVERGPGNAQAVTTRALENKGLSFISNRQRLKEGTFCASELAGIEPTPPAPKGAGYVRLDHSATVGINCILNFSV